MARENIEKPALDWCIDVGLVTEPLMLAAYLKVMVIAAFVMGALLSFLMVLGGNAEAIVPMLELVGIAMAVIMVLSLFAAVVVMGNRFSIRFIVDERGVRQLTIDRRASAASTAAVVVGVLAGSPGATGAGLIAKSQADRSTAWSGIVSVRYHPSRRAISLSNSWRTVMQIFCTPENYEAVAARVAAETAAHEKGRRARPSPLPGLLFKTVVIVIACLPFFSLPYPFELDFFVPILTMCFAIAALWLIPLLGVVSIGGLGWMWLEIAVRADGTSLMSRPDKWVPLAVAGFTTMVLVVLIIGLIRGTFASGLLGDEEELEYDAEPRGADEEKDEGAKGSR